jgi:PQQ-dependent catabolism-associated CXXCW motif protein
MLAPALLCSLAAVSTGLAAESTAPAAQPSGYWMGDVDSPIPATIQGGRVIHAKELEALLSRGGIVVVDVSDAPRRPDGVAPGAPWMPLPHRALPAALWLPGAGAGAVAPDVDAFYRSRLDQATAGNADAPVVIYCHDKCWLSWNAAKRAISYGYRRVYWFSDGIEGWTAAGQRTVIAEPQGPRASSSAGAAHEPPLRTLVVLDIELTGDLGGPAFVAEHDARLRMESARLRQDLERSGMYRIVDSGPAQATMDRLKSEQAYLHDCNGCDLGVGRELHADLVFVSWVDRVSGLILSLTYEIHDVKSGQITARKSFDFRGDNDNAWNHAIDYAIRDLKTTLGASAAP